VRRTVRRRDGQPVAPGGDCDHLAAQHPRHRDRSEPDASGRAEHQHALARPQPRAPGKGAVGRAVRHGKSTRRRELQRRRHRDRALRRQNRGVGIAAEGQHAHDPVAAPPRRHVGRHLVDGAGDLEAGAERQRRILLVLARDHQQVGEVDAGRRHSHADLAAAQRRQRHLRDR
jgi:hypothetical protein